VAQAIMAADVGYQELAQKYFTAALYVDLTDLHGNASDGVHVASAGGVWSMLVFGFAGMRDAGRDRVDFDPRLPELWRGLSFRFTLTGSRVAATVLADRMEFVLETGDPVEVTVRGVPVTVDASGPAVAPLTGQGPRLIGAPTTRDITGARRSDGSVITALVPPSAEESADPDVS
jgi:alpha,alpha-trehalose phosphorylase